MYKILKNKLNLKKKERPIRAQHQPKAGVYTKWVVCHFLAFRPKKALIPLGDKKKVHCPRAKNTYNLHVRINNNLL